jgi:hypothetical protein
MKNKTLCAIAAALLTVSFTAKTIIEEKLRPEPKEPLIVFFNEDGGLNDTYSKTYHSGLNRVIITEFIPRYSIFHIPKYSSITKGDYKMVSESYVIAGINKDNSLKLSRISEPYTSLKLSQDLE